MNRTVQLEIEAKTELELALRSGDGIHRSEGERQARGYSSNSAGIGGLT